MAAVCASPCEKSEENETQDTDNESDLSEKFRDYPDSGGAGDDIVFIGANGSSVTIKTNLITAEIDLSSLDLDFGGNIPLEGEDILLAGLDILGVFEPFGAFADALAAQIRFRRGEYLDAITSGISVLGGDIAKLPILLPKQLKTIIDAVKAAKGGSRIQGESIKDIRKLANKLSQYDSRLSLDELKALEKLVQKYGGHVRPDLHPVKGKFLHPHVQIENLTPSIKNRHIWLAEDAIKYLQKQ